MAYIHKIEPQYEPGDVIEIMVRNAADLSELGQPHQGTDEANWEEREETRRKPIISIHGEDVDEDEIDRVA